MWLPKKQVILWWLHQCHLVLSQFTSLGTASCFYFLQRKASFFSHIRQTRTLLRVLLATWRSIISLEGAQVYNNCRQRWQRPFSFITDWLDIPLDENSRIPGHSSPISSPRSRMQWPEVTHQPVNHRRWLTLLAIVKFQWARGPAIMHN